MNLNMSTLHAVAFVDFTNETDAQAALAEMNGKRIGLNPLRVQFYERPATFVPNTDFVTQQKDQDVIGDTHFRILFISKLDRNLGEDRLKTICSKFGEVLSVSLKMAPNAVGVIKSTGKAIVTYKTKDDASEAMKKLYYEDDLGDHMQVDFYKNRSSRMQAYEADHNPFKEWFKDIAPNKAGYPHAHAGRQYQPRGAPQGH